MNQAQKTKLFNEWYAEYYPRLLKSMYVIHYNMDDQEDVCQETFKNVWLWMDNYDTELCSPFTWIVMVAKQTSARMQEARERQIPRNYIDLEDATRYDPPEESDDSDDPNFFISEQDVPEGCMADYRTPESALMREEEEAELDRGIANLPDRYERFVILHHIEGMTHAEIAKKEGCTVGTVEQVLFRAREKLKTFLGEKDGELERHEGGSS